MNTQLAQGYEECRRVMQASGKSYYFATSLFKDGEMKRSTWALYTFFRVPDDIVDEQPGLDPAIIREQLDEYRLRWRSSFDAATELDPKMAAITETFRNRNIPLEYGDRFLDAMAMDIVPPVYKTYADLEKYMYGSAGVVGVMMAYVIGFEDPRALEYAKVLGYAMQLTNFLRDIDADYKELGRIYMPEDELQRFGLSRLDVVNRTWSPKFKKFMEFQISRARALYIEGEQCLPLLNEKGRFAYRMASVLYSRILTKLEQQDCNPFAGRASTSFGEKLWLLIKTKALGNTKIARSV